MPRIVIYFRKYEECANLDIYFTEPIKSPDLSKFQLMDMFTAGMDKKKLRIR